MVPVDEVTCRVAEPLLPGESEIVDEERAAVQPAGIPSVKLKVEPPQPLESLSVTVTLKETAVPAGAPALCEGVMAMLGLARLQELRVRRGDAAARSHSFPEY